MIIPTMAPQAPNLAQEAAAQSQMLLADPASDHYETLGTHRARRMEEDTDHSITERPHHAQCIASTEYPYQVLRQPLSQAHCIKDFHLTLAINFPARLQHMHSAYVQPMKQGRPDPEQQ
jgi:hypothetical protein